jgi:hypothetical protein
VLVEKREMQPVAEETTHTRAADILAQRLPSVPDKPATDANAVSSTVAGSGAITNSGAKPQPPLKTDAKPQTEAVIKPQNPAAIAKPAGTNVTTGLSLPGQSKPVSNQASSAQKKASTPPATTLGPESPIASPPAQPKPITAPPAQSDSQPPADESKPN